MVTRHGSQFISCQAAACILCFLAVAPAFAFEIDLDPPGDREFIRDLAGLLDPAAEQHIRNLCDRLLTDKATPIIVITIESMAKYTRSEATLSNGDSRGARDDGPEAAMDLPPDVLELLEEADRVMEESRSRLTKFRKQVAGDGGRKMRIETFATLLFDQWGIGHATLGKQEWNTGILLLVSRDDRKARIELGGGWGRREDALCREIMDEHIIFHFKQGQFSQGIVAGVEALDKMGRRLELPTRPRPWWTYALGIGCIVLAVFTVVSLVRRGSSGWAWMFWGVVFTIVGMILYQMMTSRGSGGGSFSGGSFGGGSSGGGGATGSW